MSTPSLGRILSSLALALLLACKAGTDPDDRDAGEPTGRIAAARGDSLVVMEIDGTRRRAYGGLRSVAQYGLHPTWVPGQARVLVHTVNATAPAGTRVHAVDLASGAVTRLTVTNTVNVHEWYPQAASANDVFFMGESPTGGFRIWSMRGDGTQMRQLSTLSPAYADYYRPAVSLDLRRLAVSTVVDGVIGVRAYDRPSGLATTAWIGNATAPRWSPDGEQVAFSTPGGGVIRVMNVDGSGLRVIAPGPYGEWFDWTRDGRWLVTTAANGLELVRVADGTRRAIGGTAGMWQPAVSR